MTATGKHKQNRLSAVRVRSVTKAGRYLDGNLGYIWMYNQVVQSGGSYVSLLWGDVETLGLVVYQ